MFILVMQFFWKYIDDLMGKGIPFSVILELLFYVSASLIPLALPLAILLSSIMTFGNLSENNELTALKASGLSLYRIMRPLMLVVVIIATATFYFANFVIPVANFKWRSLIYDIQNTKIAALLNEGAYTKELDGYAIKVERLNKDGFEDIIIHDHTGNNEMKTIRAKSGRLLKSTNGKYIFFELNKGSVNEELATQPPAFDSYDHIIKHPNNNRPSRRTTFDKATYKIDLAGFDLNRTDEELFKDDHEMLNVFQLKKAKDSLQEKAQGVIDRYISSSATEWNYFKAKGLMSDTVKVSEEIRKEALAAKVLTIDSFSLEERNLAIDDAQAGVRRKRSKLESQKNYIESLNYSWRDIQIESHRKFALTYAIIVLFFVGAPLGAIIRKGGFGAPVVVAALLFMVYFVLISIGENLAQTEVISPFLGMWFASMILTPLAFLLMRSAANDSPLFVMDNWIKYFTKKKKENADSTLSA
jgi:lipopolysaccharide export system permease protein